MPEKIYRFELGFEGELQGVGLFQGLEDTPVPWAQITEFYFMMNDLNKPLDIETEDGSPIVFFFTEKGLKTFKKALNFIIHEIIETGWQVLETILPLDPSYTNGPDLKDAIYTDEYQLAFSYAHIAEIRNKHKYHEISGVDTNLNEPLITANDAEK